MSKKRGRQFNQKMKPYLVYYYLMRNTDENHIASTKEIIGYLKSLGIYAERRSIYSDISEMNKILYLLEQNEYGDGFELDDVEEDFYLPELDEECDEEEKKEHEERKEEIEFLKTIKYDKHKKGFYVEQRKYDDSDIKMICECIYNSRSITQNRAEELVGIMKEFISIYKAEQIRKDELVTDRNRTINKNTVYNLENIRMAMSTKIDGETHTPEKISFLYLKHKIEKLDELTERKKGKRYIVSPHKIIINDGFYYLLAFDDHFKSMRTYRVDRMKDVKLLGEEREGRDEFKKIDLKDYIQRTFSMFSGETERVKIQFTNDLLDTIVDRFGTEDFTFYKQVDENHFTVSTKVAISNQFFGWICGFRKKAVILEPKEVVDDFVEFLNDIQEKY